MLPQRIGRYDVSAELGRGATSIVFKGVDPADGRVVAIKTLQRSSADDDAEADSILLRFRNEARAIGRLRHPGVVAIDEYGEDGLHSWIAMEYVEGRTLDDLLLRSPLLGQERALALMDELLEALGCVHREGICHRDLKPANIMVTPAGRVKLMDFGVARLRDLGLTRVSSIIGTPAFMAPEQFTGGALDHRADLFACGVLLYRMLTGRRAFTGATEQVMYKILNEDPPPPSSVTKGLRPAAFDAIVARAMAKDPAARYADAQAMRVALQALSRAPASATAKATVILPLPAREGEAPAAAAPRVVSPSVAAPRETPAPREPALASGAGASAIAWDPAELSRIERALATHVGPMARVMVREAARSHADTDSLAIAVACHIHDENKRRQFIEAAHGSSHVAPVNAPMASGATPIPHPAPPARSADPLSEEFKARALQAVTRKMGPIARVMVRRAADGCGGSQARFVQLLLEAIPEADRWTLQGEINKLG
jgi:eukaryotic-like serine/threonine-protein kinase